MVDIVGVVQSVAPVSQIQRKDGSSTDKRSMQIRDDSGASIEARRGKRRGLRRPACTELHRDMSPLICSLCVEGTEVGR